MRLLFGVLLVLVFSDCKREEATRWNVDLQAPIASGRLFVSDLIPSENISYDETGLVHFVINESLTDFNIDSLLQIPDTTFFDHISNSFATLIIGPGGLIIPPQSGDAQMDIPNVQLKELISKTGTLDYTLKNFVDGQLLATYALPKATLNGESVFIEEPLSPGSIDNPSIITGSFDLSEYSFDLTGIEGDSFNQMLTEIALFVDPNSPTNVTIPVQDTIFKTSIAFNDATISYARGYFGQHDFSFNEVTVLDQLSNIISGNLGIEEIEVNLTIENYAGIDAQVVLNELSGKNTNTGNLVTLEHSDINNTINISRAIDNNGDITPDIYTINLNQDNSNIDEWIENLPDSLITRTNIAVNPLGDVSSGNDFIYTDKALQANIEVDLPLCVSVDNILFRDTLDVDISFDQFIDGVLRIQFFNAFPMGGTLSLTALDSDGNESILLLDNADIVSGNATDMYTIIASENYYEIIVDNDLIDELTDGKAIAVEILLNGYQNEIIKLTEGNYFDISIYLDAEIEISYE